MLSESTVQGGHRAEEVVSLIEDNHRVFVHGAAATPLVLLDALVDRAQSLTNVELIHLHTHGPAAYAGKKFRNSFKVVNLFTGENLRKELDYDRVDYLPCFLSEIPELFRSRLRKIDVAMVQLSPPDKNGYCSLGTSVDVARAAVESSDLVLAQINHQMPRVHGDSFIHISRVHRWVEVDEPLPSVVPRTPSETDLAIGVRIAELIEDGATLQTGIGAVPDAVLKALHGHKRLGLHTEMWSDGALDLIERGVIDNSAKRVHRGKSVSAFVMGSSKLYKFIHDNPSVIQLEASYVNDTRVIARNPKVVAINSAVEIDLTGQVCADSIGPRIISGVGGQMDFIRGAFLSPGGKAIIAITSRTSKGASRIVTQLRPGAGVVTTRGHVHCIVTEFGVADLYAKTLGERARALIEIAHPEDRERLRWEWQKQSQGS